MLPPRLLVAALLALLVPVAQRTPAESLRVVAVDPVTHEPVPCRISVRTGDGEFQWGKDLAGEPYRHAGVPREWSDGDTTFEVEPGEVEVLASRPYARFPFRATITVQPGANAEVTVPLRPLVDLTELGWYGGDAHTHVVHGEKHYAVDLREVTRIARAEGLDWAAFGQVWTSVGERQPTPAERSALCRELTGDDFLCTWTREHPKDHLGHMASFPLGVDRTFADAVGANRYSSSPEAREELAHFEIARALRRLGTLAVYTHPAREYGGTPESVGNIARELPFDALAAPDTLEALDVLTDAPGNGANLRLLEFLLGRGHRLGVCGFSDACYDRRGERPGDTRTYVFLGSEPRTMANIVRAIRAGHTFASTGPLVVASVDGEPPGSAIAPRSEPRAGPHELLVKAWNVVDYEDPRRPALLRRLEVVRGGEVWQARDVAGEEHAVEWRVAIPSDSPAWYQVRVHGSSSRQFALTSPFWLGDPPEPKAAVARVRGRVRDERGQPLAGRVLAIEHGKDRRETVLERAFTGGEYELECPATCRVRVEVPGHAPAERSIFLDTDAIYVDLFRGIRRDKLWDAAFYAEIAARLGDVRFDFTLAPAAEGEAWPGRTWERRSPADVGLDAEKLRAFSAFVKGRGCVVRRGYLAYSWGDVTRRADVASAAKPIYSHFLLQALEDGKIASFDEKVVRWEPRLGEINRALGSKDRDITWRHFAYQMTGYQLAERPGAAFAYNDWQMALFWDCLFRKVYGATFENVDETVFHPRLTDVLQCEDRPTLMAFGTRNRPGRLAISVRDFARFGLLYLRGGRWRDRRLISAAHAKMAVTTPLPGDFPRARRDQKATEMIPGQRSIGSERRPDNQTEHFGAYSWMWWVNGVDRAGVRMWPAAPPDTYGAFGHGGPRAMWVVPSLDIVVSYNDAKLDDWRNGPDSPTNRAMALLVAAVAER